MSPNPTQPAPNTAACPPTAPHTPDYLWHANCALTSAVCARFCYILHDTTCSHDSSNRLEIATRAETAPSRTGRPAKPPAAPIAPGSPTEAILLVRYNAHAHILHSYRSYTAVMNMVYTLMLWEQLP